MIIGEWQIETDELNTILSRRMINKKTGEEYFGSPRYYSGLKAALKALADKEVSKTELKDFQTVVAKQDEIYKLIEGLR